MKYLDRFINFIFSLFVLVVSAIITLIAAGLIEYSYVSDSLGSYLFSNDNRTLTCIISIIVFIAALKTTVFLSVSNKKKKNAVFVDTNNGKVQIAQETIENTAKSVVMQYDDVKEAQARMIKDKKGVDIYMSLLVLPNTNLVELTSKAQDEVKSTVEGSTGVRVNNVDIKIKNIAESKVKAKSKVEPVKEEVVREEITKAEVTDEVVEESINSEEENVDAVENAEETNE